MKIDQNMAPGSPGIEPRWTSSAKDGIGPGCGIVDFPAQELESATAVVFTFRFPTLWHGRNHHVRIFSKQR